MKTKNVVVVGGGTAGWLTALYTKKVYPKKNVILIESNEIGILGAGEGTNPTPLLLLDFLDIKIQDLVKECKVSIKNGIKFTNWSSKQDSYFHPFGSYCPASNDYNFLLHDFLESNTSFSHFASTEFNHSLNDYSFIQRVSNLNKIPFFLNINVNQNNLLDNALSKISIHFDANVLAKYLRSVGEKRGIIRKEGIVQKIVCNENGYIEELETDKEKIFCDFVFDCTGFKRLIIGNFYKSKWISHKDSLPINSAIPFFLPIEKNIPPYTEATAMNYGWMWKIPLQHRFGCGYVFDNNMISSDDAKKEIDKFLGFEVDSPKIFNFEAGFYEKIWIKNCLAVGLSSGFIEPLEATSIWQAVRVLHTFFSSFNSLDTKNKKTIDAFNKKHYNETKNVLSFIYLHYVTDKKNTKFWKNFTKNNKMPEDIEYILEVSKERPLDTELDSVSLGSMFPISSFYYVLLGNNIITKNILKNHLKMIKIDKKAEYLKIIEQQDMVIPQLINHDDFILLSGGKIKK
jgi:tryptophan halogenase